VALGPTAFFRRKSGVFETAPFVVIVKLNSKNWQQKAINSNTYFRQHQFYLFRALKMQKKHQFSKSEWIFPSDFEFSFSAKFSDLLTSNEVISVLICISSVEVYRELQCKILRYDLLLCALRFSRK